MATAAGQADGGQAPDGSDDDVVDAEIVDEEKPESQARPDDVARRGANGPVIRDRRRIDPVTGQVREPAQPASPAPGPASRARRAGQLQPAGGPRRGRQARRPASRARRGHGTATATAGPARRRMRSADAGRADRGPAAACRPSTRTTASGWSATGSRCASRRWPTCSANCCRSWTTSAGPASTASSTGGFKSVAESLEAAVAKLGLTCYGEDGDPFDPNAARGADALVLRRRDRADLRADPAARLQDRRAGSLRPGAGRGRRARRRDGADRPRGSGRELGRRQAPERRRPRS